MGSLKWRTILIAIVVVVALYYLYPTVKLVSLSEDEKAAMPAEQVAELRNRAIHLGLDLQGGMHVVLEIDKTAIEEGDLDNTMSKAETVIRNRIDKFGVSEPLIQKQGNDRLVVQLAGSRTNSAPRNSSAGWRYWNSSSSRKAMNSGSSSPP